MKFPKLFNRNHVNVIKAKQVTIPQDFISVFVSKKEILKQPHVFNLKDRIIAMNDDVVLVHLKRNATPEIFPAYSVEMDWARHEKVELPMSALFALALRDDVPLVELEDRFMSLTNPIFYALKEEKEVQVYSGIP
ncbi:hypothetical protein KAU88_07590 [Candidatus Bathyarchaeota archaeon]|nr:hypothetical protein [Candidatus Bathyarchaeota archaeon]